MKRSVLLLGVALIPLIARGEQRVIEIILADGRIRPAFYEVAPTYLATSMHAAVKQECAAQAKGKPSTLSKAELKPASAWLCSGDPIYFLRGVSADGEEGADGFVCEGEASSKYYAADIVADDLGCVAVYYDSDKKTHSFE
jgi:hypothetical protein